MSSKNALKKVSASSKAAKLPKKIMVRSKPVKAAKVQARIQEDLKVSAEEILSQLGVSPTDAITMFYHQIVLHHGIPFNLVLPSEVVVDRKQVFKDALQYVKNKHSDVIEALGDL